MLGVIRAANYNFRVIGSNLRGMAPVHRECCRCKGAFFEKKNVEEYRLHVKESTGSFSEWPAFQQSVMEPFHWVHRRGLSRVREVTSWPGSVSGSRSK